jgi:transitional endoplasmic reticulum ATPase
MKDKKSQLEAEAMLAILLKAVSGGDESLREVENIGVVTDSKTRKVVIPAGMSKRDAARELVMQADAEEKQINVDCQLDGWHYTDSLTAIKKVAEETFGWINSQNSWYNTPTEIDVTVDVKDGKPIIEKCFYGVFTVAGWSNAKVYINFVNQWYIKISTSCQKKYSDDISEFYALIRERLAKHSIFRAKTVEVTSNSNGEFNLTIIENKGNKNIILNDDEESVLDKFIIPSLRDKGKRCYLFSGGYGTGKTETAMRVGDEATKVGLTFFYCKDSNIFNNFLNYSKRYQPALIFLEDIDEIASGAERDSQINKILNEIDGVSVKGNSLTVIFTTNNPRKINPAFRRPGRIDNILPFKHPTLDTRIKIYKALLKGVEGADRIDYVHAATHTPDIQGAFLAEICTRCVKLAERQGSIDTQDLLASIASMKFHIEFMNEGQEVEDHGKVAFDWVLQKIAKTNLEVMNNQNGY